MQQVMLRKGPARAGTKTRTRAQILRAQRGLGQSPSPLPTCANLSMAQTGIQGVLIAGGGLATLIGVIGAIFSDTYKEEFAIAAGAGLVSSFVGGVWAAGSIADVYKSCGGDQGVANALAAQPTYAVPSYAVPTPVPGQ